MPERRKAPRAAVTEEAAIYRRLAVGEAVAPKAGRLLKRGAVGLAAISFARWLWRQSSSARDVARGAGPEGP